MMHDQILETALRWHQEGRGAAIATVVATWGSAPRQAGSQLAISGAGEIMGSVSGGCVEGAVVIEALEALELGTPRLLSYGVADETAFSVGLACGGTIRILVEPLGPMLTEVTALVQARAKRQAVGYSVDLDTWQRAVIPAGVDPIVDARLRSDRAGIEATAQGETRFVVPHNPPLRMIVVGAVHIAQPLVAMARLAGYDPVVIDPRETFAAAERFPGERVLDEWPDEAMRRLAPDARTAVITLTHDSKLDDPAITEALAGDCFYLGCLGSKKTHAARLARLEAAGIDAQALARIHAPVGLAIGAMTPAEIAISIMAQVTAVLRGA